MYVCVYTFSCCSSSSLCMSMNAWRVSHMISRAPVRVFSLTALLFWPGTCKHTKKHPVWGSTCVPSTFLWLIFPSVCISYPPWWTQQRPLSPEVCGEAHTEHHSDLQRAAQPYCNAALPELCAAYEHFRLQPEREKCEEQSMWEYVNAYCMLKTHVWWCTWLR